jgi:hypothetical protein
LWLTLYIVYWTKITCSEHAFILLGKYYICPKYTNLLVMQPLKEGTLKRIILLATVVALTAAMLAASSLSSAQEDAEYDSTTGQATVICAPWSQSWSISEGQWYSRWYRWCVDTSLYDPLYESSWYIEWGNPEWGDKVNLCPEAGQCTVSPGGGMQMTTP